MPELISIDENDPNRATYRLDDGTYSLVVKKSGETFEDVFANEDPGSNVPVLVSPRQIRIALLQLGILASVEAWIASEAGQATVIEWEYATEVRRSHVMWAAGAVALGKTEAEIDALFILAAGL